MLTDAPQLTFEVVKQRRIRQESAFSSHRSNQMHAMTPCPARREAIWQRAVVSRVTDLIAQVKSKFPELGADLDREFKGIHSA
jgi:hypothetical protein